MAYEINFCETKDQFKHLAEVVTGKTDGSPTGADIDTSTLEYTGQVRETLPSLLQKIGLVHTTEWSTNPLVTKSTEVIPYAGTNQFFRPTSLPYQVDSATHPDPNALVGTELVDVSDYANKDYVINEAKKAYKAIIESNEIPANSEIFVEDGTPISEGRGFFYQDEILIALKDFNWDSTKVRYVDYITLQDFKYRIDCIVDGWGAKGDAVLTGNSYSGTDDTQAFKDAQNYIQDKFRVDNAEVSGGATATLKLREGATYLVKGNHVMGNMSADGTSRKNPISFRFDKNGGVILWEPLSATDSFIDYGYCLYRPRIDAKIVIVGSVNPASFFRTKTFDGQNSFQEGNFDGSSVIAGTDPSTPSTYRSGNYIDTIFDIDGDTLSDRCSVKGCKFQQWGAIYTSSNPEAVAWAMDGSSAWTWVDGAAPIKITEIFSGSHTWDACDIVLAGDDQKLIVTTSTNYGTSPNMGEITLDATRVEVRSSNKFTAVDASHGRVLVKGLNCRNGNADFNNRPNFISAIVRNEAEVRFIDSLIPSKALMLAIAKSQLTNFTRFNKSVGLILDRCELQNDSFIFQPFTGVGTEVSYRLVITSDLLVRNAMISNTIDEGYYGNCDLAMNNEFLLNGVTGKSGGTPYINDSLFTYVPGFSLITDIDVYIPSGSAISKISVSVANQPIQTFSVTAGINKLLKDNLGITAPSQTGSGLKLDPLNSSGQSLGTAPGDFIIRYSTAKNLYAIGNSDTPEIV